MIGLRAHMVAEVPETLPTRAKRLEPVLPDIVLEGPAEPAAELIVLQGVEKRFGDFRPVFVGLDVRVRRGDFLVLRGAGGSGKSVLLRMLAGLEDVSAGTIRIAGEELARMGRRARAHLRRSIGMLPPGEQLLERRSVIENVALASWVAGATLEEGRQRARSALALVGIDADALGSAACVTLAGGQRHCVALARALVNRPALLLLDDLGAPLDFADAARVLSALDRFTAAGVTVIATMRSDVAVALPARARVLRLQDGKILQ